MMKSIILMLRQAVCDFINDIRQYDINVTFSRMLCTLTKNSKKTLYLKSKAIIHYLTKEFSYLIDEYKSKNDACDKSSYKVWVFWLQGVENMPDIIRYCLESKYKHLKNCEIVVLTKDNLSEFVSLPDYIWEQYNTGKLRIQHLADIIRIYLIKEYGGLWLDASIYCLKDVDVSELLKDSFYSLKIQDTGDFFTKNMWSTFVIGGKPHNKTCSFIYEFFCEYCKTNKKFIDYFMFDYIILLAYINFKDVHSIIDNNEITDDCYWLNSKLLEEFTEELSNELLAIKQPFHKISWNRSEIRNHLLSNDLYTYLINKEGFNHE